MGLFNFFSKKEVKSIKPYKQEAFNIIYDMLFCDHVSFYKTEIQISDYPWNVLLANTHEIDKLSEVIKDNTLDTRCKIIANYILRAQGSVIEEKELLGVIVEVGLPGGLDVLAAYKDGTARYINHVENMVAWESKSDESNKLINQLFIDSENVINIIAPWDKDRKAFPGNGMVRLTFLVSDGLYFGEGPFDMLQKDPMAGPVIYSATKLLTFLTSKMSEHKNKS